MDAERANQRPQDLSAEELSAVVAEIERRVRARHPSGVIGSSGIVLPDLMPLVHARDAAEAKVAAIGTVNPRPPGLANNLIQFFKRNLSRALGWFGRGQVDFNRGVAAYLHANLEALSESRRAMGELVRFSEDSLGRLDARLQEAAARHQALADSHQAVAEAHSRQIDDVYRELSRELAAMRAHWAEWRPAWEERITRGEVNLLRTVAEMQGAFQHRTTLLEANFRDLVKAQHADYNTALERVAQDVQKRLWADLEKVRADYERMIHTELRMIRQRASSVVAAPAVSGVPAAPPAAAAPQVDWLAFSNRFRGSEDGIRAQQQLYVERFAGMQQVLDLGCGRGEFLEAAQAAGIGARGIDANADVIAICRAKGLDAEVADLFGYLDAAAPGSLDGVYCSQVVEHLPPAALPDLVAKIARVLRRGGLAAFETPNPECLAIFATHFYLDPTHTRPVPPGLLSYYLTDAGFGNVEVVRLHPAVETMPSLAALPEAVREQFFGALDYAVFARKL